MFSFFKVFCCDSNSTTVNINSIRSLLIPYKTNLSTRRVKISNTKIIKSIKIENSQYLLQHLQVHSLVFPLVLVFI